MATFYTSKTAGPGPTQHAREALIREMRVFLLENNDARFSKQLLAFLLEEGCNLPLALAKPLFYRHVVSTLSAALEASGQAAVARRFSGDGEGLTHPQFHWILDFIHTCLPDADTRMAAAAIDTVGTVLEAWRLEKSVFTENTETFERVVRQVVARIVNGNRNGRLADWPVEVILRRLRLALTASLLRHARDPDRFRSTFGPIHRLWKTMPADPMVFCRVMSFLQGQIPYFRHIASQVFWRTLNHLDADRSNSSTVA